MTIQAKLTISGLVLGAAILAIFQFTDSNDSEVDALESEKKAAVATAAERAEPAAREERAPVERVQPAGTGTLWQLRGSAVRRNGDVVPGAKIRGRMFSGYETKGEPLHERLFTSAPDGTFTWSLPAPDTTVALRFVPEDDDRHYGWGRTLLVVKGDPPPGRFALQLFPIDSRITGRVTDARGRPIPGARAGRTSKCRIECDEEGRYELPASSDFRSAPVYAVAPGHAIMRKIVKNVGPAEETRCDFELRRAFRIRGRVTNEAGVAVAGAKVTTFFSARRHVLTDADGQFLLDHLDPGRPRHSLYASAEGYTKASAEITTAGDTATRDLVLRRGASVRGVVLGPDREPVAGAFLLIGFSQTDYNRITTHAGDDGRFELANVPVGKHRLTADRRGFSPNVQQIEIKPSRTDLVLEIQLERGHFLAGRVVGTNGAALPGMTVAARQKGGIGPYIGRSTTTDAAGRFRLEQLPDGPVRVEAHGKGRVRAEQLVEQLDRTDVTITLQRAAGLAGRVVDGVTNRPLEHFRVRLVRPEMREGDKWGTGYSATWEREGHTFTKTDGYFRTENEELEPGAVFGIEASAEGYAPTRLARVIAAVDPKPDDTIIRLYEGSRITGQVLDDRGRPLAGVTVKIATKAEPIDMTDSDDTHRRKMTRTGARGEFQLEQLPPGELALAIVHGDWPVFIDGPFEIARGQAVHRTVRLVAGGKIEGIVRGPDAEPRAGARVRVNLSSELVTEWREVRSDAKGRFAFERLTSGRWQVNLVERRGRRTIYEQRLFAEVADGKPAVLQLGPAPGSARVSGTVRFAGTLPSDLSVSADWQGPGELSWPERVARGRTVFVEKGRFVLSGLAPGKYRLSVSHWTPEGPIGGSTTVEVSAGEAKTAAIALEQGRR